jgi:hypothetical protein
MPDPLVIATFWITGLTACNLFVDFLLWKYVGSLTEKREVVIQQLVGVVSQAGMALWGFFNLFQPSPFELTWYLQSATIGFYAYDLLYMLSYAGGRKMYLFHAHHICTVLFLAHLQQNPYVCPPNAMNITIMILELSAASININSFCKRFWNSYAKQVELVNIVIYFITRMVIYPIVLYTLLYQFYVEHTLWDPTYGVPSLIFTLLHFLCILWFRNMVLQF